jgi:hypothetical protein
MCKIIDYIDEYPDGKQLKFQVTSYCKDRKGFQICARSLIEKNGIRKIVYGEPTTEELFSSHSTGGKTSPPNPFAKLSEAPTRNVHFVKGPSTFTTSEIELPLPRGDINFGDLPTISISDTPRLVRVLGGNSHLPKGDCRYISPDPVPETMVQRCACIEFALKQSKLGDECNCGHQAWYHAPEKRIVSAEQEIFEPAHMGELLEDLVNSGKQGFSFKTPSLAKLPLEKGEVKRHTAFQNIQLDASGHWHDSSDLSKQISKNESVRDSKVERETDFAMDNPNENDIASQIQQENHMAMKSYPSRSSSVESLQSLVDSIFSTATFSSASTTSDTNNAFQRLLVVLKTDAALKQLYEELKTRTSAEKFKRNFGTLLKRFALDLEKEAKCWNEQRAAKFIRSRARVMAQKVADSIYPSSDANWKIQWSAIEQDKAEISEDGDSDEEPDEFVDLEKFVTNSTAFQNLCSNIRGFLGSEPSSKGDAIDIVPTNIELFAELPFAAQEYHCGGLGGSILCGQPAPPCIGRVWYLPNFLHKAGDLLFAESPIPHGLSRVRWKCVSPRKDEYQIELTRHSHAANFSMMTIKNSNLVQQSEWRTI